MQRQNKTKMTKERLDKLNAIGFAWDAREEVWNEGFGLLSAYKEANGNCLVPTAYKVDGYNLGAWVANLRKYKTKMTKESLGKLNAIGFAWDAKEEFWNEGFGLLSAYKEANGNCLVPARYKVDGYNLGAWVSVQRRHRTKMTKQRLDKLNSIGFVWATK